MADFTIYFLLSITKESKYHGRIRMEAGSLGDFFKNCVRTAFKKREALVTRGVPPPARQGFTNIVRPRLPYESVLSKSLTTQLSDNRNVGPSDFFPPF